MYREKTTEELLQERRRRIKGAFTLVLALLLMWLAVTLTRMQIGRQGATVIRETVLTSAKRCYAIEGAYPASIEYLEKNYGLMVNDDDYVISYETFADNICPNVVVMPR